MRFRAMPCAERKHEKRDSRGREKRGKSSVPQHNNPMQIRSVLKRFA
jgi:hypothetical protein